MNKCSQLDTTITRGGLAWIDFQKLAAASSTVKFDTLTFLGTAAQGGLGIHLYVVQYEATDGSHLTPFAVTVYQGKVVGFRGLSGQAAAQ